VNVDVDTELKVLCCMLEKNVEKIHFTNTINVAMTVKTKTLFFEALILRIWLSMKPILDFLFVVIFIDFILSCSDFLI
jgi:hypothetical protein